MFTALFLRLFLSGMTPKDHTVSRRLASYESDVLHWVGFLMRLARSARKGVLLFPAYAKSKALAYRVKAIQPFDIVGDAARKRQQRDKIVDATLL